MAGSETQLLYGAFLKAAASRRLGVQAAIASALAQLTPSSYLLFHVSIPPIALRRIDPYLPIGELSGGNAGKYVRATYTEQQTERVNATKDYGRSAHQTMSGRLAACTDAG